MSASAPDTTKPITIMGFLSAVGYPSAGTARDPGTICFFTVSRVANHSSAISVIPDSVAITLTATIVYQGTNGITVQTIVLPLIYAVSH